MSIEGDEIILLTSRTQRQESCGNVIGHTQSITEYLFQVETQTASVLEIISKRCSSTLEISAFDALYDCQGYADLACHFHSGKSFRSPQVGKPSTYPLNDTGAISFPELGGQKKYDIIANMCRCLYFCFI